MIVKTCIHCGKVKGLGEFYAHPRMADGHLNACKECVKAAAKSRRVGDGGDAIRAYDRGRSKLPHRIQKNKVIGARWRSDHPDRRAAQVALNNAVRDGRVEKLPCFVCGTKAEAHHPDYSAPLSVVWLCSSHHKQTHAMAAALT